MLLLFTDNMKEQPIHIKLDGTIATISLRKSGIITKFARGVQSIISFMFAPTP